MLMCTRAKSLRRPSMHMCITDAQAMPPPLHTHTDNNSKVAAAALQGVDKLVASYGSALESSLGLLVPVANRVPHLGANRLLEPA